MLTFEEVTSQFLSAATSNGLTTHPEYWSNSRSLEREFSCACHMGSCEEAEQHSSCVVTFSWGSLDTALSLEGPAGICDFFHEVDQDCQHLHTSAIPPLVLDLSYSLALNGVSISEEVLLTLTQMLRLRASERSRRTIETRPGISMVLQDNHLHPDMLTLQQRVELPIWHPHGMRGLHEDPPPYQPRRIEGETHEILADDPHPEEWVPHILNEVSQDILQVLDALDATIAIDLSSNS